MANVIKPKRSNTAGKVPTTSDLTSGELGINMADQKAYINNGTSVVQIGAGNLAGLGDVALTSPSNGQSLVYNGTNWVNQTGAGSGNVVGPSSATDNALARFDTTTGKLIQNSVVVVDDSGNMSGVPTITDINYIDFNTSYATTLGAGQLGWDGNDTLGLGMIGGNVIQHIGEDQFFYCKASSAISKGQVVMFTGAVGASGVPTGAPATGITDGTYIMGVAAEAIALNGFGLVQSFGTLRNVDTSGYADGDILWYNPSVAGGLTSTKPSAPNVKAQIAAVINGGSSGGGTILIRVNAGSVLGGTDSNVQFGTLSSGDLMRYNGTYWTNVATIGNSNLQYSSITINGSAISLGGSVSVGTVTSVTGTSPISSSGGTTPAISISQATTSTNGYLSSTDWNTFNGKQAAYTNLTSIGSLANGSGWLKNNGSGTFSYSTPTYSDVGAPSTSGTGATGTWAISISGNAATVTNGVYTTGTQTIGGDKTFSGATTLSGGVVAGFTVKKQNTTGEGGEFYLEKSDTSTLAANLTVDLIGQTLRFFEGGGTARGAGLDISGCAAGAGSVILTNSNVSSYAGFAAGTAMLFVQTSAPTGWTKSTAHDNKALRIVSGAASSGGSVAFTTAFTSKSVSGSNSSTTATNQNTTAGGTIGGAFSIGATTLSTTQMPSHTHNIASANKNSDNPTAGNYFAGTGSSVVSGATGGGGSHTHSISGSPTFTGTAHTHTQDAHSHTFTGTNIDLTVQYVDAIIATKN